LRLILPCLCVVVVAGAAVAGNYPNRITLPKSCHKIHMAGSIVEINAAKAYMIINENMVLMADYTIGDKAGQTLLKDLASNAVALDAFQIGQKVKVIGYRLPNDRILAVSISRMIH
jgi:hypothetical protein